MHTPYLGKIPFELALEIHLGAKPDIIFGFEPARAVITLGTRGHAADDILAANTIHVLKVDRGGQATLHAPGQLVIFPVVRLRRGARAFVRALGEATVQLGQQLGRSLDYDEQRPGVYDQSGSKVAAIGLRIRDGITRHGLAINVSNDLELFRQIRACGVTSAAVANLATNLSTHEIFALWLRHFNAEVDNVAPAVEC